MSDEFRGINKDAVAKDREAKKRGEFWTPDEGDTLVYVAPCPPGVEGFPYVASTFHFNAKAQGSAKGSALCLDKGENALLTLDPFLDRLREMERDTDDLGHCPICEAMDGLDKKVADEVKRRTNYLFNIIPMRFRKKQGSPWVELGEGLRPYMCSYTVWDGICSVIGELGDVTDPNSAVLIQINREGTGQKTRYKVTADMATVKKPLVLDKATKTALREALADGGKGDLLRIVAAMTKDATTMAADWGGMELEGKGEEDKPTKPACFGVDWDDSKECAKCPNTKQCRAASAAKRPQDAKPTPAAAAKPTPKPESKPAKPANKPVAKPTPPPEPEAEPEAASDKVKAGDCQEGETYEATMEDGSTKVGTFSGKAGKWALFTNVEDDDDIFRVKMDAEVEPVTVEVQDDSATEAEPEAAAADDDDEAALKELEAKLKARAKDKGKAK